MNLFLIRNLILQANKIHKMNK